MPKERMLIYPIFLESSAFLQNVTQAYLQKLVALQKKALFKQVAVRCICILLEVAPHFNFCETLLAGTIRNISSSDDVIR